MQSPNPGDEKRLHDEHEEVTAPLDDSVIGKAFWGSLFALIVIALIVGGIYLWLHRTPPAAEISEAAVAEPEQASATISISPPNVPFTDVTTASGINFQHINGAYGERLLPETMGAGAAFIDYDNDGDQDLLFINANRWAFREADGPDATSALYRNDGDGTFADVSTEVGLTLSAYGMGVTTGDFDGDGWIDLFITALGKNHLLRNLAGQRFEDVTTQAGVGGGETAWSTGAAFADYDRDGDLDLFVGNYVQWSREIDFEVDYKLAGIGRAYGPPTNYAGTQSYLYENLGDGRFSDRSATAGIEVKNPATGAPVGKALSVLATDIDADGWPDFIVANDTVRNFLFHNLGDGRFEEIGIASGLAFDTAGSATGAMGIDIARYNNDSEVAIAMGNFANEMTSLYIARDTSMLFSDEAIVSGIGPATRLALNFGLVFLDYDLDGRVDLFQVGGHIENEINLVQASQHYEQAPQLFWNCGAECARTFLEASPDTLNDLAQPLAGRGAAYGDIDNDGDLDLVITQVGRDARLFRNEQVLAHHWLRVNLTGLAPNTSAIGARLELHAGEKRAYREITSSRSYLSQAEMTVTFGLGETDTVDRLIVIWPNGSQQTFDGLAIDKVHTILQQE